MKTLFLALLLSLTYTSYAAETTPRAAPEFDLYIHKPTWLDAWPQEMKKADQALATEKAVFEKEVLGNPELRQKMINIAKKAGLPKPYKIQLAVGSGFPGFQTVPKGSDRFNLTVEWLVPETPSVEKMAHPIPADLLEFHFSVLAGEKKADSLEEWKNKQAKKDVVIEENSQTEVAGH